MKEINKKILKPISLTPETMEYIEKSDWLLRNYKDPESVRKFNRLVFSAYMDADTNEDELPDTWIFNKPKGSELQVNITNKNSINIKNLGNVEAMASTRKFSLEPSKKYLLTVKMRGELNKNTTFEIFILSDKGKYVQFHNNSIRLGPEFKEYRFEFVTTEDIKNGNQSVRFDHNGNDEGYIEISDVSIYSLD
jgi:hypothetical protein